MSLGSRLREFLTLTDAETRAEKTPEDLRTTLARALAIARQRAEAADTLWANGHAAEALVLGRAAFDRTLDAAATLAAKSEARTDSDSDSDSDSDTDSDSDSDSDADTDSDFASDSDTDSDADTDSDFASDSAKPPLDEPWRVGLRRAGVDAADVDQAGRIHDRLAESLPETDEDVGANHGELFREALRLRRRLESALSPSASTVGQIKRRRWGRWATVAIAAALVVVLMYFSLRTPREEVATASGYFGDAPEYAPDKAVDGDEATEWLLPDNQNGWIEVRLSPPRDIGTLTVKNGHNRHFMDRAIERYSVELFDDDGESLATAEGAFEGIERNSEPARHEVGVTGVAQIRLTVLSHHRLGAALAELDWE